MVKAKETDIVLVKLSKEDIQNIICVFDGFNQILTDEEAETYGVSHIDLNYIENKLRQAKPEWRF